MAIRMQCPKCRARVTLPEKYAGEIANCPTCWDPIRVPQLGLFEDHPELEPKPVEPVPLERVDIHRARKLVGIGVLAFVALAALSVGGCLAARSIFAPAGDKAAPTVGNPITSHKLPAYRLPKLDQ